MRNTRKWLVAVVVLWSAAWCVCAEDVALHFIDVGHGDAIYIRLPGGYDILIDGGGNDAKVLAHLRENMEDDLLDLVVATHYHCDHVGGLSGVLLAPDFRVLDILSHGVYTPERFASAASDAVSRTGGTWYRLYGTPTAGRGSYWQFGEYRLTVLGPGRSHERAEKDSDNNNNSIVLLLAGPAVRALFTGDAEQLGELDVVYYAYQKGVDLSVDVLKVGHHGSNTSTTWSLLAAARPAVAVISDNGSHTRESTLDRLAAVGARVYATYHHGAVRMSFDGVESAVATDTGAEPLARTASVALAPRTPFGLFLDIESVSTPVRRNHSATVKARTVPGADSAISVYYASGPSTSRDLKPTPADPHGRVAWSWRIGSRTELGSFYAEVTAVLRGQLVTSFARFDVR